MSSSSGLNDHTPDRMHHIEVAFCSACCVFRVSASVLAWRRGVVVSGVRRMNEVDPRRARLVPEWVTVFRWVYRLRM